MGLVNPALANVARPVHTVRVDAFYMAAPETTDRQYCEFLNGALWGPSEAPRPRRQTERDCARENSHMPKSACPSADGLSAYLLGTLPKEAADRVSEHLERCPDCEVTIADLETAVKEDTLLSQLRRRPPMDPYEADPQCRAAVARAEGLVDLTVAGTDGPADLPGTQAAIGGTLGDYQLLEKLGEGGMGTIYKALHTRLDRVVAVKLLPSDRTSDGRRLARFEREMKAVGRLNHPNIVQAYHAREIQRTMVLAMEYVDGLDLSKIVSLCGPLTIADACELARQTALGLEYAHQQGLVHRDIKPSNPMLAGAQQPWRSLQRNRRCRRQGPPRKR